ncbi:DoxX family protein [Acidipropionibacterium jensenii]|uniref:DoxX family protein n=1 Tax=Acidipropionibacterium jensenii TaxID=1749 RepID=UPI000BC33DAC|nr:DoxX family membrane protein [Acidipropionibacterium jensenii]MDN5977602.1 DoxX family membrane protein [Acidipropionibacterium jensenii]MDN5996607.1 DoxX family membrane protein [Acidipropionibacterium jensenii]MDN6427378.1 DoxX family membrane protein [Acidipropionibacterium jensenii]MDN6441426.1 DoxX family membrane protein [Acidipropionibacterium jensenii]MDN6480520.1 DoxX family membrane protein [Acidipropionibacterium jensenii]
MSIIRGLGRTLFASYFIVNGTNSAVKPDSFVADAEPVADRLVPLLQRTLPPSVSARIPEDTKSLVRLSGAAQALGGLAMATGLLRRVGAATVALTMVPHVIASVPDKTLSKEERAAGRRILLRNVALLGAAMMASRDTAGRPSLAWRADQRRQAVSSGAQDLQDKASKTARKSQKKLAKASRKAQKKVREQIGA